MTNLEKLIENDRDNFILAIAEKICINTDKYKVNLVAPYLCGDCFYSRNGGCTAELKQWLESEVEE